MTGPGPAPSFREAVRFWLKLGFISFGGPAGQIAIMHTELVEKRRWVGEERFLHALNYCMLLPGPEAQQLATYLGWLLHRTWGGLAAGILFVLPSALILWVLSWVYVTWGEVGWVASVFRGLKPAVLGLVAAAVLRIGRKTLHNGLMWLVAGLAFTAICVLNVPFPFIVLGALLAGLAGGFWRPQLFLAPGSRAGLAPAEGAGVVTEPHTRPSLGRAIRIGVVGLGLWWGPVVGVGLWLGWEHSLFREGIFFSKAALVTFGGAYAVLPYVSQQAVEHYQWLSAGQMLDGLGLAETTPGPLIMVLQFVGFLGGWHHPGPLSALAAASLGALITTWTTFVPCFLWILLGGPHVEQVRGNLRLACALSAVTAAVVGVILNLAVWFGRHLLFPEAGGVEWFAVLVGLGAFVGIARWKWDIIPVVLGAGLLGVVWWGLFG